MCESAKQIFGGALTLMHRAMCAAFRMVKTAFSTVIYLAIVDFWYRYCSMKSWMKKKWGKSPKRGVFDKRVGFKSYPETYTVPWYDRTRNMDEGKPAWNRLPNDEKAMAYKVLNEFKEQEMEVHEDSKMNTKFYYPSYGNGISHNTGRTGRRRL